MRHATWVEFLQAYNFTIKHKASVHNVVANALSRKYLTLISLRIKVVGFDILRDMYKDDVEFGKF